MRPRDMAKLGLVFLNGGRWKSKQIVPENWVKEATNNHISYLRTGFDYGYQWWRNQKELMMTREELKEELKDPTLAPALVELESRIDGLALLGFDCYTQRREKLCELKVNEVKARVSGLLRRAGIEIDNP